MAAFTRWVLAHRKLVVVFWLVITIVGIGVADAASKAMDQKFSVPGREGYETNVKIAALYDGTGGNAAPIVPVVTLPEGTTASDRGVRAQLETIETTLAKVLPGVRIAGYGSTGSDAFLSDDGRTAFAIAYPTPDPDQPFGDNPKAAEDASAAVAKLNIEGSQVHLTGYDALNNQAGGSEGPGVLIEALVGGFGALLVLGFVFASFLAIVPLMMAIPAIMTSFLIVYGITFVTDVSPIVQFLIALIGLGVAIDYALIVVVRWREEIAHGHEGDEAIVRAMETAGRAVVFSGTTVAIGLLALILLPLPFLRSVGYGGMVIPLVSVAVALTLLPVVLHTLGRRLDWPHRRTDDKASKAWTGWAERIVKHRVIATLTATVILGALILAASTINFGISDVDTIAHAGDAKDGLVQLEDSGIGTGILVPDEILVADGTSATDVATAVNAIDGIHGAVAPDVPGWSAGGTTLAIALPTPDASTQEARDLIDEVRTTAQDVGPGVTVGGLGAQNQDFIERRLRELPADDRPDRGGHLHPAGAGVPFAYCYPRRQCF